MLTAIPAAREVWIPESPALSGELQPDERCPSCGMRLRAGQPCLICSAAAGEEK
jgi:hypothetical protein